MKTFFTDVRDGVLAILQNIWAHLHCKQHERGPGELEHMGTSKAWYCTKCGKCMDRI